MILFADMVDQGVAACHTIAGFLTHKLIVLC